MGVWGTPDLHWTLVVMTFYSFFWDSGFTGNSLEVITCISSALKTSERYSQIRVWGITSGFVVLWSTWLCL